ncbi:MAG: MFS transporter [Clostridiaceae bacterium]|nr:MFS transporter [Clostridiaceae bacterium]
MYSLLIALLYLAYIGLGLPSSLIGSAWPAMHNALNVPISYVGVISMVISGGTIVSSLLSDKLTRKLGTRVVTVLSVFITTLTLFGFSFSNTFWMLIVFAIPYGLASGAIDAAVNNYVAVHYESKHLSWLHSFWGVGAIISPFIMSYALTNSTWDKGYLFVTYIQLGISLLLLVTLPVWKVNHREVEVSETTKSVGLLDALKIRGVPFLLIGFFAYCAMEGTVKLWASSYFVEVKGVTDELAALYASLFFIGLTVGRIFGGFLTNKLSDRKMIRLGPIYT